MFTMQLYSIFWNKKVDNTSPVITGASNFAENVRFSERAITLIRSSAEVKKGRAVQDEQQFGARLNSVIVESIDVSIVDLICHAVQWSQRSLDSCSFFCSIKACPPSILLH